jgi:alpha-amylase
MAIRQEHAHGPSWEHPETDADIYVYSRAGDRQHSGLLLVLCDQDAPAKQVRTPFVNSRLRDLTGNQAAEVATDPAGTGTFPVKGHSYSVWSPESTPVVRVTFQVIHAQIAPGQTVYVVGNVPQLGGWNPRNAQKMDGSASPKWSATVSLPSDNDIAYKYVVTDAQGNVTWEGGQNRKLAPNAAIGPRQDQWQK